MSELKIVLEMEKQTMSYKWQNATLLMILLLFVLKMWMNI